MDLQLGLFGDAAQAPVRVPVGPAPLPLDVASLAARLPPGLRLGTSSWSFPGWEGLVYDRRVSEATLARHGLSAYAAHPLLRTVGVDRTFYRSLAADDFRAYADEVPPGFRFLVKADRLVTTPTDPDASVRGWNPRFLDPHWATEQVVRPVIEGLGPAAGPILFQFPPIAPAVVGGRGAFLDRLNTFLGALPRGPLYAVELRTPAFLTETYVQVLEAHRAAHGYVVHPAMAPLRRQLDVIQPYDQPALVVRWMLHGDFRYEVAKERYAPFDRIVDEDDASRDRIAVATLDALLAEREVFVIANNKAEGSSPLSIARLAQRIADWGARPGASRAP